MDLPQTRPSNQQPLCDADDAEAKQPFPLPRRRIRMSREQWTRVALASERDASPSVLDPTVGSGVRIIILGAGAAGARRWNLSLTYATATSSLVPRPLILLERTSIPCPFPWQLATSRAPSSRPGTLASHLLAPAHSRLAAARSHGPCVPSTAGLSAGATLRRALPGATVLLVEARDRIGGRIHTAKLPLDTAAHRALAAAAASACGTAAACAPAMVPAAPGAWPGGACSVDLGAACVQGHARAVCANSRRYLLALVD